MSQGKVWWNSKCTQDKQGQVFSNSSFCELLPGSWLRVTPQTFGRGPDKFWGRQEAGTRLILIMFWHWQKLDSAHHRPLNKTTNTIKSQCTFLVLSALASGLCLADYSFDWQCQTCQWCQATSQLPPEQWPNSDPLGHPLSAPLGHWSSLLITLAMCWESHHQGRQFSKAARYRTSKLFPMIWSLASEVFCHVWPIGKTNSICMWDCVTAPCTKVARLHGGILKLLPATVAWAVFDHKKYD
jgi:hypothetical protein